uniref:Exosome complex component RRP45 n=1 Tax=Platynereis dumerilii TaxID=6359 RepID=C7SB59_PLADU|nr:exosome component 9 [Platynereis dumerilii]
MTSLRKGWKSSTGRNRESKSSNRWGAAPELRLGGRESSDGVGMSYTQGYSGCSRRSFGPQGGCHICGDHLPTPQGCQWTSNLLKHSPNSQGLINKMRDTPMSNCEKEFILDAISKKMRLDGRGCYDYRRIKIQFGIDRGCCQVHLGKTIVMAQTSCEVTTPKQTRPSEGNVFVNVELSPMAAPHFEAGRQSDAGVELTRILERCIKESRCVDTESLCIMSGVKVWTIRVDVHVLNHNGNLIDAASIAAISSLVHFRRPDVSVSGEDVTIHSLEDRDPIPLSVHHMPICVTCAFYHKGTYLLIDPTDKEENVMDGKVIVGMNKHREICTFQLTGSMLLLKEQVLRCSNMAVVKVGEMTALIEQALQNDTAARAKGEKFGFAASIEPEKITVSQAEDIVVEHGEKEEEEEEMEERAPMPINWHAINFQGPGIAVLGEGGPSSWEVEEDSEKEEELKEEEKVKKEKKKKKSTVTVQEVIEDSGSEEEEVVMLDELDSTTPKKSPGKETPTKGIDLSQALKKKQKPFNKRKKAK